VCVCVWFGEYFSFWFLIWFDYPKKERDSYHAIFYLSLSIYLSLSKVFFFLSILYSFSFCSLTFVLQSDPWFCAWFLWMQKIITNTLLRGFLIPRVRIFKHPSSQSLLPRYLLNYLSFTLKLLTKKQKVNILLFWLSKISENSITNRSSLIIQNEKRMKNHRLSKFFKRKEGI